VPAITGELRSAWSGWRDWRIRSALQRHWRTLLWGLPGLFALAYLIAVLVDFRPIITSINMDSDVAIAPVLAKLFGQAPSGSHVLLGNHPYYEEFLFLRATAGLPFYRQLWDTAPFLWTLAGFAILGWSARRVFGNLSALLAVSALICLGQLGRFSFFTFDWHGLGVFHTILIGAALVWLTPRAGVIKWRLLAALSVSLGLISALPVASDPVFPFWALIPAVLTTVLMAWRGAGRSRATLPAFALLTTAVAVAGGVLIGHFMRSGGVTATTFPLTFVPPGSIVGNFELLFEGYMSLAGGYFFGIKPDLLGYVVLASGGLVTAAFVLGVLEVRRLAAAAGPRPKGGEPGSARLAYVSYWAISLLIQSAMFVFSSAPVDTGSSRYVLAGYVAIAALIPLLSMRGLGWRLAVTAGVCVFAFSSIYQLARQPFTPGNTFPTPGQSNLLLRFAQDNNVQYGYAGYWDAADLTWLTHFKLKLYPVVSGCGPAGLCPQPNVQIDTWYRPRPGSRSMLVADSSQPGVSAINPQLGKPLKTAEIGNLTVAIYPFDIASKL
jgi:hypothetical protein